MITIPNALRRWLAFGRGIGIEITGPAGAESLRVVAVRVGPNGARVVDQFLIEDVWRHNTAGAWGTEYSAFVRKHGLGHVAAGILLPRRDVIVRTLSLPGVEEGDLANAVGFQLDGLHPYSDDDVVISWTRVPATPTVLVAIARRDVIARYSSLFAEAGVKVGSLTCSPVAIASARRLWGAPTAGEVLAYEANDAGVELYGESAARPIFSSVFDVPLERAAAMAGAELRLDDRTPVHSFDALLAIKPALASCAAMLSACPGLSLDANLLPVEQRHAGSKLTWIPAAALSVAVLLLAGALAAFPRYQQQRYQEILDAEIAKVTPAANRAVALDREIERASRNTLALDDLRARAKADMDVLGELTKLLPPPTWLNSL